MQPEQFHARNVAEWWLNVNVNVFGSTLQSPASFKITNSKSTLGEWSPDDRTLSVSRHLLENFHWWDTVEVLKHEMAHQYVSDVLGVEDETAHGPAFRMICDRYGICPRAVGLGKDIEAKRKRIQALLNLGQSANPHEAENAVRKAHQMMVELGITPLDNDQRQNAARPVGPVLKRTEPHHAAAASLVSTFFRVRCIWIPTLNKNGGQGEQLELLGAEDDLDLAEHVFEYVCAEAERHWEREPVKGKRKERDFKEGFINGVQAALQREREGAGSETSGLVLIRRSALDDFFKRRHPRTVSRRSSRTRGEMYGEGLRSGKDVNLRRAVKTSDGPKLLGTASQ